MKSKITTCHSFPERESIRALVVELSCSRAASLTIIIAILGLEITPDSNNARCA